LVVLDISLLFLGIMDARLVWYFHVVAVLIAVVAISVTVVAAVAVAVPIVLTQGCLPVDQCLGRSLSILCFRDVAVLFDMLRPVRFPLVL
jgi:hypothetical protein